MTKNITLNVFSAGVAKGAVTDAINIWKTSNPNIDVSLTVDGSVSLIRRCLSGEPCDLLILADNAIIDSLMMPHSAKGYICFAGNRMVVAANGDNTIDESNWEEKLLDPSATFDHHNPADDPGGYRAVLSMMLAENIAPGLSDKLLNHPGHWGMDSKQTASCEAKYTFDYYTRAISRGACFAELPEIMNLSSDKLAAVYSQVSYAISDNTHITGAPICHALTVPETAANPTSAKDFIKVFLSLDFQAYGFILRFKEIGKKIV